MWDVGLIRKYFLVIYCTMGKRQFVAYFELDFFLFFLFSSSFFASGGGLSICPEILQYAQWLCLSSEFSTVRDAGFEPGTTASEVWSSTNEPPHPLTIYFSTIFWQQIYFNQKLYFSQKNVKLQSIAKIISFRTIT